MDTIIRNIQGDITKVDSVTAIVNAANNSLLVRSNYRQCPYYRNGDEYQVVKKQM